MEDYQDLIAIAQAETGLSDFGGDLDEVSKLFADYRRRMEQWASPDAVKAGAA